jgi:hypothetical protein
MTDSCSSELSFTVSTGLNDLSFPDLPSVFLLKIHSIIEISSIIIIYIYISFILIFVFCANSYHHAKAWDFSWRIDINIM